MCNQLPLLLFGVRDRALYTNFVLQLPINKSLAELIETTELNNEFQFFTVMFLETLLFKQLPNN